MIHPVPIDLMSSLIVLNVSLMIKTVPKTSKLILSIKPLVAISKLSNFYRRVRALRLEGRSINDLRII